MDPSIFMHFMLTDDCNTLLAVRQGSDGSLELMTTPVTIVQNNSEDSLQLLKTNQNDDNFFNQLKLNNILSNNNQQPNSTSIEVIDIGSHNYQINNNKDCHLEVTSNPLHKNLQSTTASTQDITEEILLIKKPSTEKSDVTTVSKDISTNLEKNSPPSKKYARKSLGRTKKNNKTSNEEQLCFKCDVCGQEFKKQYSLQKHMHEHAQDKPHNCPKCPASFNIPTNFTLHMATHNIGEPKCPECGRKFARIASLKSHMLIHEVDENLYCTECDDIFATKSQLDAHSKLHSEKWSVDDYRKCKLCRKQFTQPLLYRQHLRDHYKLQTKTTKQTKRGIRHRTVYKCRLCLKAFEKPSQLVRHIRVHTGEKPYKCNLCNRSFTQKGSVRIHMWQHNGIRPYSCSFCHAKFSQKGNLNAHILRVHNIQEGSPMYRCSQCPCIFKKLGSLNGHMKRVHSASGKARDVDEDPDKEEEPFEEEERVQLEKPDPPRESENLGEVDIAPADLEAEPSELPKDFQDGFVVTDDSRQTAVVTLLDKMSNDAKGKYIKIKQRFVNNSRLYECSFCDKNFKKPSDLMRHLRIHTQEKPYKCKICNRSFTLKSTMLSHEKTHKNPRKFSCNSCTMYFTSEKELLIHEKIHSKSYKCALCGKKFNTFDQLKTHSTIHQSGRSEQEGEGNASRRKSQYTSEVQNLAPKVVLKEPLVLTEASNGLLHAQPKFRNEIAHGKGRPHKCPACPAAFMKLSHLKQHHRKHTGERPYVCALCDRKFTTNSALKAHRRIHDLLKPYKCYVCNRNFSTSSSMKRHHITHSNKRPYMCPYCNKTFKTTVNCRKHMKVHKQEIALQQLESQKKQQQYSNSTSNNIDITMTPQDTINNQEITFQPITNNLTQNLNEQLQTIIKEKDTTFMPITPSSQNINVATQNISLVDTSNIGASQALHADETGTITLPNYSGNQSLTPESIREIEETLNQQLFNIGMNLALNNTVRQIEEHNNASLETREQPILSIIYDNGKSLESSINSTINTNVFSTQYDTFDINQITLQEDNEIDLGITQSNATNMASILPQSIQEHKHYSPQLINQDFQNNMILKQNYLNKEIETFNNSSIVNIEKEQSYDESNKNLITELSFQCHICNMQQFTADSLNEHLKIHEDNKEFQCTHCFSKFCTSGGLSNHLKIHETEETHKCYECNEEFSTTLKLRKHIKDHVKFELQLKNITNQDDININTESKKDDELVDKKYNKCRYCPKIFRKPSDLIRHVRTHTGERPYQCNFCDRSFAVKYTLDSHLKIHGGEKSFYCNVCNCMFATKDSLKVHMRLHTGAKLFKCTQCDMKFRTSGHRKIHLASHAQDLNSLSTPNQSEAQLDATIGAIKYDNSEEQKDDQIVRIVHTAPVMQPMLDPSTDEHVIGVNPGLSALGTDQINFSADCAASSDSTGFLALNENNQLVANLQFLLANGLVTIQTEDPTLTSQLPLSSSSGVQNDFLATSVVQKVQDQANGLQVIFSADIPDAEVPPITNENDFQLNHDMVLQLENIDSTVPDKNEENSLKQTKPPSNAARRQCDICGKAFAKPCQLERHKRIHTGERPFKCDFCGKSFAQKSTLQMHQKRHTGDRPYCCPQCQRSFTQSGNLQTHLKRKHKVDPAETKRLSKTQQFVNYDPKLLQSTIDDARVLNFDDLSIVELFK